MFRIYLQPLFVHASYLYIYYVRFAKLKCIYTYFFPAFSSFSISFAIYGNVFHYLQDTVLELEFQGVKKKFTMLQVCGHLCFFCCFIELLLVFLILHYNIKCCTHFRVGLYVHQGLLHQNLQLILLFLLVR